MTAYRFCRTDDIALLAGALNCCWSPYFPDEPPTTPAAFKSSIRDLQVWCSSCMVAFAGPDPIGVLIGAKRPSGTLVHKIAVHPDHRRQGHGRHLLTSLSSKLAILGPPRIVAEVPHTFAPACELFRASGYVQEAVLTDYILTPPEEEEANERQGVSHARGAGTRLSASQRVRGADVPRAAGVSATLSEAFTHAGGTKHAGLDDGRFVIPVTVDDLAANGLLGEPHPHVPWERSVETLTARKDSIAGLAVASDERIEAYLLYVNHGTGPEGAARAGSPAFARSCDDELRRDLAGAPAEAGPPSAPTAEIVSLRSLSDDGGARLERLLSRLRAGGTWTFRFAKVHPAEVSKQLLEALGFRPAGAHVLYAARAQGS